MEELAKVIRKFENIELLATEIEAGKNINTVEELTDYLEDDFYCA